MDAESLRSLIAAGGDKIADIIKDRAGHLLDDRKNETAFLKERSHRLMELTAALVTAPESEKASILASIDTVTDAITSEVWAIATDMSAASRSTISAIIATVKDFMIEALPIVGKILLAAI